MIKTYSKNITEFYRYIIISIIGYSYVLLFLYLLIQIFDVNKSIAFLVSYGSWYIVLYYIQLRFLFKTNHEHKKLLKFIIYLFTFYILANSLFNLGLYFKLNYMLSTIITITILMPFRYIFSKYIIFK